MKKLGLGVLFVFFVASAATAGDEYQWDDGTSENSIGLTAGGELAWIHHFDVTDSNNVITGVSLCFGSPSYPGSSGVYAGQDFSVYVWNDPNGDGNPLDAVLLNETIGQVAAGSIDSDVLQTVNVGNVALPTDSFFIGASADQPAGGYPGSLDQTVLYHHAWVAGSAAMGGFDPNNLNGGIGLFNLDDIGLGGNWLLRANAIPEPASLTLLALGGLALLRRR